MNENQRLFYEFGSFRLDRSDMLLWRANEVVPLTPKTFELLLVMVESNGRVLSKEDLMKRVWPDSFVEEANLSHNVYKLREALGEGTQGEKFIETVPRRGYRFIARVLESHDHEVDLVVEEHSRTRLVVDEDTGPSHSIENRRPTHQLVIGAPPSWSVALLSRSKVILPACALLLLAVGAYYFWHARQSRALSKGPALRSIAILPFKPLVATNQDEALQLGMTEALINKLSGMRQISVRPTSAVRKYIDPQQDPVMVGRELQVDSVLDGNLQLAGDRIRLTVRLVRIDDATTVWADKFDEKLTDIFAVQDAISSRLAGVLAVKLTAEEQRQLAKHTTEDAEAYQLYARARYFYQKFTPASHKKAEEYFKQAIARDPRYAQAYAGLADTYGSASINNWMPSQEGFFQSKVMVQKALEIDNSLAEAHTSLGAILLFYDLEWAGAEREFKLALDLNPNHIDNYEVYCYLLSSTGRLAAAIQIAQRGLAINPVAMSLNDGAGEAYYWSRRYDDAINQSQKTIDLDPSHAGAYFVQGQAYDAKGMYAEAITSYQKAIAASERTSNILGALGHAYAAAGRKGDALKIRDELGQMSKAQYVSPWDLAVLNMGLGEKEKTIELLSRAYQERAGWIITVGVEPVFDPIRSDPRFLELLQKFNFPTEPINKA